MEQNNKNAPDGALCSPPSIGCHHLPQIPNLGRKVRTAQSKSSVKHGFESALKLEEETVLHVEGTSTIIKISKDGNSEVTEKIEHKENVQKLLNDIEDSPPINNVKESENNAGVKRKRTSAGKRNLKGGRNKSDTCVEAKDVVINKSDGNVINSHVASNSNTSRTVESVNVKSLESNNSVHETTQCDIDLSTSPESPSNESSSGHVNSPEKMKIRSKLDIELRIKENVAESDVTHNDQLSVESDTKSNVKPSASSHVPRCVLIAPVDVPSKDQLNKLMAMESSAYDQYHPPQLQEGDMMWGKVSGHPYWPCMVSRCPFSKLFTRIKGEVKVLRSYHVQFFGNEVERGWINEPSLIAFEGKMNFLDKAKLETTKPVKKGKAGYNPFKINISRRHAWNLAVEEAEEAFLLPLEERKRQFNFDYVFLEDVSKAKQAEKKQQKESASLNKPLGGAKRKRVDSESDFSTPHSKAKKQKLSASPALVVLPAANETSFDTYYANHRSSVMEQHPDWGTPLVFEFLQQQWSMVSSRKGKRTKQETVKSEISETVKSPGKRIKRPTKKIVESLLQSPTFSYGNDNAILDHSKPSPNQPRKRGRPPGKTKSSETTSTVPTRRSGVEEMEIAEDESAQQKAVPAAVCSRKASHDSDSSTDGKGKGLKENEPYELEIFKLMSTCKIEKENVCSICEKNGDVLECTGSCGQFFHSSCLSVDSQSTEQIKCLECTTGIHSCFQCKKADPETRKCLVSQCSKYYHEDCIKKLRLARMQGESKAFICPLHICGTCAVENVKNQKATKGRLFRCIRCPVAYHAGDYCVAAGSKHLGSSHIICSNHFQPNKSLSLHAHLNITWCFICSKGGTLLCCETCPAAYHAECVKVDHAPEGAWYCSDCTAGQKPLYGNIVWIKVGNYRWWPGEICHPRHVPLNIQEKPHQIGEFPVRFFGSHDYYWIHRGRVFLFQEGDKGSRDSSSRGLFKVYMRGVKEATEAFKLWTAAKAKKEEQEQERNDKKPAPYKMIKSNVPIGTVQIHKAELSEIPRCECKPTQEDACTSDCLNRMMMYECHPAVCGTGDKCHNQRFQKRQYPDLEPFKCAGRGWGLRSTGDIQKGQFVIEYVGDLIDEEECKRRIEQAHDDNISNFYMLTMDKNRIIDAGPKGNYSRFMNHSCCPNLETQKWMVNGDIRVGLFALCDIPKGTELTFNYNLECLGNEKKACACGAENCSGFLGVRPKTAAAAANEKKAKDLKKKRKKKKLVPSKEHEDECFRCGEGGELVMCDKFSCSKVYHLQCLDLTKPPTGKWLCPWHHCDECGKPSVTLCSECPNSYCSSHAPGHIFELDGSQVCFEHEDQLEGVSHSANVQSQAQGESCKSLNAVDQLGTSDKPLSSKSNVNDGILQDDLSNAPGRPNFLQGVNCEKNAPVTEALNQKGDDDIQSTSSNKMGAKPGLLAIARMQAARTGQRQRGRGKVSGVCRTKARYRAKLSPATNAKGQSAVHAKPSALLAIKPGTVSPLVNDSDNDSISDLVIDI